LHENFDRLPFTPSGRLFRSFIVRDITLFNRNISSVYHIVAIRVI
jgi:hypothetical protein